MNTALVTGATGLVGQALLEELVESQHSVTGWDVRPPAKPPRGPVRFERVSLDGSTIELDRSYDAVYHLAANTENREDRASPSSDLDSIAQLLGLLRSLETRPPKCLVFSSSQLVYPRGGSGLEAERLAPESRFGAAKASAEIFLRSWGGVNDVTTVSCRLANVVGPAMQRGIIPDLVDKALEPGATEIRLLGDGRQRRAYTDVEDVAAAMVVIAAEPRWAAVNVGGETSLDAFEVAEIIREEADVDLPIVATSRGAGWRSDPGTVALSTERLKSLGWRARYDSIDAVRRAARGVIAHRRA